MRIPIGPVVGALFLGGTVLATPALAAPAPVLCDAYSGTCTGPGTGTNPGGTSTNPGSGTNPGGTTTNPGTGTTTNPGTGTTQGGKTTNPGSGTAGAGVQSPATLPFTGGELVLITTLGLGALAGGTVLVVAGRRRNVPAV